MSEKKQKSDKIKQAEISVRSVSGAPENVCEMLTSYGTYEIQPTADTENFFPTIAQGMPGDKKRIGRHPQKHSE